jgi:hypothetical protein
MCLILQIPKGDEDTWAGELPEIKIRAQIEAGWGLFRISDFYIIWNFEWAQVVCMLCLLSNFQKQYYGIGPEAYAIHIYCSKKILNSC